MLGRGILLLRIAVPLLAVAGTRAGESLVFSSCALPVSPIMRLVQSPHASSPYSTRVLLARTACAADDAVCTISARLESLLDPSASGAYRL